MSIAKALIIKPVCLGCPFFVDLSINVSARIPGIRGWDALIHRDYFCWKRTGPSLSSDFS
jgi:hypothetical protein